VERTSFLVDDLDTADRYKLTTGLIVPRPIGWIGSRSTDGVPNLAPYSFFNAVATNPPVLLFSTGVFDGIIKDSLQNIRDTGVFTASLVDHDLAVAMNDSSATLGPDVDEFEKTGLTAANFGQVDAPGVEEAKAVVECKAIREVEFGDKDGLHHVITFGEVIAFHIDSQVLDGTRIDPVRLDALGRLAGTDYTTTRDQFRLDRPD
jgi:flavin reductase (DIM6/NTAB) family NADH-FMN oxidoreductase RutF